MGPVDLKGSWRLASFEGGPVGALQDHEILMLATSRSLRASSQCVQFWQRYHWANDELRVEDYGPVMSCARGLSDTERAFDETLSRVDKAQRVGGELILSAGARRLVFVPGQPAPVIDLSGSWRLRTLNGQTPGENAAIMVIVDRSTMTAASDCMRAAWTYEQVGHALELRGANADTCERTRTPWEERFFEVLGQVSSASPMPSDQLLLNGSIGQMELDRLS